MAIEETKVSKEEVNLDELLGTPGPSGENIMIPEEAKPNVFTRKEVDLKYLNDKDESETPVDPATPADPAILVDSADPAIPAKPVVDSKAVVDELTDPDFKDEPTVPVNASMIETIKGLIKKGKIVPFDDDKKIEDYNSKDVEELIEANFQEKESKIRQQVPLEFFDSLPEELKVAAKYVADGGTDMKGLFRALGQAEEVISMDIEDPENHEKIVRQFLTTTGFGTPEEIDEEIGGLKDRDELEKKATQFKPKLDKMQEAMIGQKLAEQERRQAQQSAASKAYINDIYKTLAPGEINGVKVDRKTQEMLYSGLVQPRYPSVTGKPTNLLGHLLEKYQYVEPRHDLIAEALWLLADPDTYKAKLMDKGKNKNIEKTVRTLRTEEANRTPGSTIVEKEETTQRRIPKSSPNFFKR